MGQRERTVPPSQTLEHSLEAVEAYPDSVKAAIAFYADYQAALAEMVRVTRGAIIIVIGPRVLRGIVFENGEITVDLMRGMGIQLKAAYYRQLPSKRLPKMRQFGAAIDRERILGVRKMTSEIAEQVRALLLILWESQNKPNVKAWAIHIALTYAINKDPSLNKRSIWKLIQEEYVAHIRERFPDQVEPGQSYRRASGDAWEMFVAEYLNSNALLRREGIRAVSLSGTDFDR